MHVEVFMSHFCWLFVLWQDHLGDLWMAIRNKDAELARRWSKSEQWCTVIQLMQASRGKMVPTITFFLSHYFLSLSFFLFFFLFFFVVMFCLLNSLNLWRGSIGWCWLVKDFFFTSLTTQYSPFFFFLRKNKIPYRYFLFLLQIKISYQESMLRIKIFSTLPSHQSHEDQGTAFWEVPLRTFIFYRQRNCKWHHWKYIPTSLHHI